MSIFLIALLILVLFNLRVYPENKFFYDALDKSNDQSTCIKGFFCVLVFLRHATSYVSNGTFSSLFNKIDCISGQLIVVPFLFFSGFGIIQSYKNNNRYFKTFFRTRICKTLVHFDMAVALFVLLNLIIGNEYSLKEIALSFVAWESIGNSNWFIFSIVAVYIFVWIASLIFKNYKLITLLTFILAIGYSILMFYLKQPWWYNTIWCMPFGMLYASYKENIESFFCKSYKLYFAIMLLLCGVSVGLYVLINKSGVVDYFGMLYNLLSISFSLFVVGLSYCVKISNPVLRFFGKLSFSIYILQRLPMIILVHTSLTIIPTLFVFVCFVITILIAVGFNYVCGYVDKYLFSKNAKIIGAGANKKQ